jgi:hypothetical protein
MAVNGERLLVFPSLDSAHVASQVRGDFLPRLETTSARMVGRIGRHRKPLSEWVLSFRNDLLCGIDAESRDLGEGMHRPKQTRRRSSAARATIATFVIYSPRTVEPPDRSSNLRVAEAEATRHPIFTGILLCNVGLCSADPTRT